MTVSAPFHDQLVESIFGYTYFAMHFSPLVGQKLRFLQVRQLMNRFHSGSLSEEPMSLNKNREQIQRLGRKW